MDAGTLALVSVLAASKDQLDGFVLHIANELILFLLFKIFDFLI